MKKTHDFFHGERFSVALFSTSFVFNGQKNNNATKRDIHFSAKYKNNNTTVIVTLINGNNKLLPEQVN